MKKGQIMDGVVERVDFPNKGIIRTEEGMVTVKNTIPGQSIRFVISKKRSGRAEGRLLEILEPSHLESRAPVCDLFPDCGGCTWQTMPYEEQLRLKADQVRRLLESKTEWSIFEGIHPSPKEFAYRNKMEFSFGDAYKDGPLCLGLHKRSSHYDVLTASGCQLVHPDMTAILTAALSFFQERRIPYYHKMTHEGILRHLLLRRSEKSGDLLACLVTTGVLGEQDGLEDFETVLHRYAERLMSLNLEGRIVGILHMRNDSVADIVQSEETTILYGQDYFYETLLGLRFKITPFSFFQTNSSGAEVLYSIARQYVEERSIGQAPVIFDLYSGTGTIAQMLAPVAKKVIGVEIVEEAVEAARVNARMNDLDNCTFLAGDVLKVLDTIPERPDFIVLDPPRDGVHPKALQKIIAYSAPCILYISCKPTSLARDLEVLLANGYREERMCCVDMFPQTTSVETIVLLSNRKIKPDSHVRLSLDMEDYYRFADQRK
ncbi:MAG: 23S rRNA (uracil(1939)-C(5))-methyltransferase RlmD [Lachnospiraceae bacterium]|nr:23S rRNA (uracil(1939)-C(5))-methyltransferase RlmD [Lachnospiraceae bacterium]